MLELGCSCGPNLALIQKAYPAINLAGIDVDQRLVDWAVRELRTIDVRVGNITKLPWDTQSVDVILVDAVLMYLTDDELKPALEEIERVARKAVIVIDRFDKSVEGVRSGDVRARNYKQLLEGRGFTVAVKKLTSKDWPDGVGWKKSGTLFVATK